MLALDAFDVLGYLVGGLCVLVVLYAILVGVKFPPAVRLAARLRRRRTARIENEASSLGLRVVDPAVLDALTLPFSLFGRGTWHSFKDAMEGSWQELPVALFVFVWSESSGRGSGVGELPAAATEVPLNAPRTLIERRSAVWRSDAGELPEIAPPEGEFWNAFRVHATDPEFPRKLLDGFLQQWLLEIDEHWRFELYGGWLLCYFNRPVGHPSRDEVLRTLAGFVHRIPEHVIWQYPRP